MKKFIIFDNRIRYSRVSLATLLNVLAKAELKIIWFCRGRFLYLRICLNEMKWKT